MSNMLHGAYHFSSSRPFVSAATVGPEKTSVQWALGVVIKDLVPSTPCDVDSQGLIDLDLGGALQLEVSYSIAAVSLLLFVAMGVLGMLLWRPACTPHRRASIRGSGGGGIVGAFKEGSSDGSGDNDGVAASAAHRRARSGSSSGTDAFVTLSWMQPALQRSKSFSQLVDILPT
jgi:hypothetical protein